MQRWKVRTPMRGGLMAAPVPGPRARRRGASRRPGRAPRRSGRPSPRWRARPRRACARARPGRRRSRGGRPRPPRRRPRGRRPRATAARRRSVSASARANSTAAPATSQAMSWQPTRSWPAAWSSASVLTSRPSGVRRHSQRCSRPSMRTGTRPVAPAVAGEPRSATRSRSPAPPSSPALKAAISARAAGAAPSSPSAGRRGRGSRGSGRGGRGGGALVRGERRALDPAFEQEAAAERQRLGARSRRRGGGGRRRAWPSPVAPRPAKRATKRPGGAGEPELHPLDGGGRRGSPRSMRPGARRRRRGPRPPPGR